MSTRIVLTFAVVAFVSCFSTVQPRLGSIVVQVASLPSSSEGFRGYRLTDIPDLLRTQIVEDFRTTVGAVDLAVGSSLTSADAPVLELAIVPGTYTAPNNMQVGDRDQPEVVWFLLDYTIRTVDGVEKKGQISALGPDPRSIRDFQEQQRGVVKGVVVRLRRVVAATLG